MFKKEDLDQSGFYFVKKNTPDEPTKLSAESNYAGLKGTKHPDFKLWISDLLTIQKPDATDSYRFGNHHVTNVDIYGVVTEIEVNRFGELYKVDDGTGEIGCWYDNRKRSNKENLKDRVETIMTEIQERAFVEAMDLDDPSPSTSTADPTSSSAQNPKLKLAEWLKREILRMSERTKESYDWGDTVQVTGKLADFRGERCIRIYNIREVTDINEEVDRRWELLHLYKTCYSENKKTSQQTKI